jgi:hypothetical protein
MRGRAGLIFQAFQSGPGFGVCLKDNAKKVFE